jgi:iron(III) transport system permease protein
MSNPFKAISTNFRTANKTWLFLSLLIVVLISIPLLEVIAQLFKPGSNITEYISNTIQLGYVSNTFNLIFGIGSIALLVGVGTAWVVSNYNFFGRNLFNWSLILPLTIPSYIIAYTYAGIFDYAGPIQSYLRNNHGEETARAYDYDIMTMGNLIVIMALVLYPYVYVASRAAFSMQATNYLEAARSLGKNSTNVFFRIALPLARPAIVGGLFLVIMEVLNDYGAMKYYGINTFTTEIFKVWAIDLNSAVSLAALLLVIVFGLLTLERWQRGKANYVESAKPRPLKRKKLTGWKAVVAFTVCFLPLAIGFIVPVIQLSSWAIDTAPKIVDKEFIIMAYNSIVLAFMAAVSIVITALIIIYAMRLNRGKLNKQLSRIAVIGYAIPGAIIAVGVMQFAGSVGEASGILLIGSIVMLIFAYVVRFLAVGFNTIEAGFEKTGASIDESARSLGSSPIRSLFRVHIPLVKTAILGGAILAFVDVMKELPLTLILRPFDFDTLATNAYEQAKINEAVPESAPAALIIIIIGIIPIFLLHKIMNRKSKRNAAG